jgi:hypothetical protein
MGLVETDLFPGVVFAALFIGSTAADMALIPMSRYFFASVCSDSLLRRSLLKQSSGMTFAFRHSNKNKLDVPKVAKHGPHVTLNL